MDGFFYPNEAEVSWGLLIVLYPYITGLVAGAFVVSSFYHAFGVQALKPVARFALITSLAFVAVAPLPLVVHLGRPERAPEIFMTPNFRSAMAGFGYILLFYEVLLLAETWLAYRPEIVKRTQSTTGLRRAFYSTLTLGSTDLSEKALALDHRAIKVLALVGIPSAFLLHGYVGFLFGSIKANPWWSTPLMPIIFLMSAIVSGVALLIVLYVVVMRLRKQRVDQRCLAEMTKWLFVFILVDFALEGLEVLSMAYENDEAWQVISHLLRKELAFSFFGVQMLLGVVVPAVVLGWLMLAGRLSQWRRTALTLGASMLVLVGIFAMRWNVVIGGQLFSKSFRGYTTFVPSVLGREGVLMALALLVVPFAVLAVLSYLLPTWEKEPALDHPEKAVKDLPVPAPTGLAGKHVHAVTRQQPEDDHRQPTSAD